jgi:hypothetical protein
MVISETTVRPMDGAVEHPRMDWLRVGEQMPWQTIAQNDEQPPYRPNPLSLASRWLLDIARFERRYKP